MDVTEIRRFLEHRYPFALVDRVTQLEAGKTIKALKNVTINEPFFNGHFPHKPIMPGVLIIEALAQATGLLGFKTMSDIPQDDLLYVLVGLDKVKFKKQVIPGDQLELRAEIIRHKGKLWIFKAEARVDGAVVVSAEIKCATTKVD
ncbi:MAG: 3-hydroxyacyl-ACP dehydratase FabZ [Cocleimonas sp.]|nr:3-hydroxyacyl-ACP dehydratase FabZ [Cocleimonas sp.]